MTLNWVATVCTVYTHRIALQTHTLALSSNGYLSLRCSLLPILLFFHQDVLVSHAPIKTFFPRSNSFPFPSLIYSSPLNPFQLVSVLFPPFPFSFRLTFFLNFFSFFSYSFSSFQFILIVLSRTSSPIPTWLLILPPVFLLDASVRPSVRYNFRCTAITAQKHWVYTDPLWGISFCPSGLVVSSAGQVRRDQRECPQTLFLPHFLCSTPFRPSLPLL